MLRAGILALTKPSLQKRQNPPPDRTSELMANEEATTTQQREQQYLTSSKQLYPTAIKQSMRTTARCWEQCGQKQPPRHASHETSTHNVSSNGRTRPHQRGSR